ncbi:hypothetical protein [Corallibacter sp.]|uniref:hypothetical protein n=1 Tax=Corallibacter sp. TaxID=2038084 RepID=UPI003AB1462D
MNSLVLIISFLFVAFLIINIIKKKKHKGESQLSAFEHPSTFKKPDIEMVSKTVEKSEYNKNIKTIRIDNLSQKK